LQVYYSDPAFVTFIEKLFRVSGIPGTEVLMLPLGYMIGTIINAIIFWIVFERDFGSFTKAVGKTLFQSFEAAVLAGFGSYVVLNIFEPAFDSSKALGVFFHGFISGSVGILVWFSVLLMLKNREIHEVLASFRRRISKKTIVAEQEVIVSETEVSSH
jgi:hypothetical protein